MNESLQLEPNFIVWTARDRWVLRVVGALLGLIWGLLGIVVEALLVRDGVIPSLTENPAMIDVIVGMVFGVGHASQFWLARAVSLRVHGGSRCWSGRWFVWHWAFFGVRRWQ